MTKKFFLMAGLAVGVITMSGCQSEEEKKKEMTAQLPGIKTGDVFSVKEDNHYTLYRIKAVTADSVYFSGSKQLAKAPGDLLRIDESGDDDFHLDETLPYAKKQLEMMVQSGEIFHIHQK